LAGWQKTYRNLALFTILVCVVFLTACTNDSTSDSTSNNQNLNGNYLPLRLPVPPENVFVPVRGDIFMEQDNITLDISNASRGYIMVQYLGYAPRAVARIEKPDAQYPYDFNLSTNGQWDVFPLTKGSGVHYITILENVHDQMFATALTTSIDVTIYDSLLPFLYPNQYVNFSRYSQVVALAAQLALGAHSDIDVIRSVYQYIIENIDYDHYLASQITAGMVSTYIPDLDRILETRLGICFDYAALMVAMLRAQHIPSRLEIGFVTGGLFHAWVSVYTQEYGWVNAVKFSAHGWSLMDPTFSASGPGLEEFIGDATNYRVMFFH